MRSSVDVSSSCRFRKFWLALRSGYASATANRLFERAGQHVLGLRLLGRAPRALMALARALRDGLERAPLVGGVALHRLDQVRDEVVAALELHVDLRPRVVDPVAPLTRPL